jgi:hypothetical protein
MAPWKKKSDYIDLSEKMRKKQRQIDSFSETPREKEHTQTSSGGGFFNMFGGNTPTVNPPEVTSSESSEEKRRKLAKRLMDMTSKIESLENEVYQLKQRLEVMERKQRVGY